MNRGGLFLLDLVKSESRDLRTKGFPPMGTSSQARSSRSWTRLVPLVGKKRIKPQYPFLLALENRFMVDDAQHSLESHRSLQFDSFQLNIAGPLSFHSIWAAA